MQDKTQIMLPTVRGGLPAGIGSRTLSRDSPRVMRRDQDDLARFCLLWIKYIIQSKLETRSRHFHE